jgi:hypothetical protein
MTTPADELHTAAAEMRRWPGPAAEPLDQLLDALTDLAREYPQLAHDHNRPACDDYACDVMGRAITLARAINAGGQP